MSAQAGKKIKTEKGHYEPLGASFDGNDSNFAVLNEGNASVWLLLYEKKSEKPFAKVPFSEESRVGNILSLKLPDFDIRRYAYNFLSQEDGRKTVCQDPYARRIYGREKFGSHREGKVQEEKDSLRARIRCGYEVLPKAQEGRLALAYEDLVIYGVHVRGFSKKKMDAPLLPKERGTFLGLAKNVAYFKELGVNYISLMPCYEFDECPEAQSLSGEAALYPQAGEKKKVNYWGYGKASYFAPKASYAAGENVCAEFFEMVQTFHDQGMEVGMELCFPDSASPKFMEEAACFWVKYYGIDGFRIYCSREGKKHLASVPYLGRTKLIFENWEQPDRTDLKSPVWKQIGISNSAFLCQLRSFLKGDCHKTEAAFHAMTANGWNTSMVNYMAGHDGFTLFDSVSYDYKHNEANGEGNKDGSFENFSWNCGAEGFTRKRSIQNLRLKMLQNAFVLLLLSQGTPYIHNGDEFANSQEGNNNAWCQDNEMGWLNWKHPKCYDGLQPFVKRLIAFRREHKVFHQKMPLRMIDTRSCGYPDLSCHGNQPWRMDFENDRHGLGLLYCGDYVEEPGEGVYVVYNMYWEEQEFYLPRPEADKAWHLVLDTQQAGEAAFVWEKAASGQQILVAPRSIRVYETGPAVQTEP